MKTKKSRKLLSFLLTVVILAVIAAGIIAIEPHLWGFHQEVSPAEQQLRTKVVQTAEGWLGCKESDGSHKPILDVYNSHKPLARGYAMKETDAWCSAFVSAISIQCGFTQWIPTEVGCEKHIGLFQELNAWEEADDYIPLPGDYIFYSWDNCSCDDCDCSADHVGIVVGTFGGWIKVIEGNYRDAVGYHYVPIDHSTIRGYGLPDYSGYLATNG